MYPWKLVRHAALLALKMEEEATSQRKQAASGSWKVKEIESPLEPPRKTSILAP